MTLRWDESLKASWLELRSYAEGEEFRNGMRAAIALCQRKRNSRHLGDGRCMAPINQNDQRWINEEWFPQVLTAGVCYMAVLMPKAAIARLSVRYILNKVNDTTLVTNHFDDMEAARAWLRTT